MRRMGRKAAAPKAAPKGIVWEYGKAEKVLARLTSAAAKAGVNVEGLKVEGCALDQTWGDRCGFMFYGASDEVNKRAASWYLAQMGLTAREGSYEAQRSMSSAPEPFTRSQCSNGALNHCRGHTGEGTETKAYSFGELTSVRSHGYAVAYVYYPCAD